MKIIINGEAVEVGGSGVEGSVSVMPVTDSEYRALTDTEKNADDKAWLVTDANNANGGGGSSDSGSSGEVYSTEETRIGTWIDGKPLYRVVVSGILPNELNSWVSISLPIQDIDKTIDIRGYYENDSNAIVPYPPIPFVSHVPGSLISIQVAINATGNIVAIINSNAFAKRNAMIIVEYTKTTD